MSGKAYDAFKHILYNIGDAQEVVQTGDEYYFKYAGTIFSVLKRYDDDAGIFIYGAYVYPHAGGDVAHLVERYDHGDAYDEPMVRYSTDQPENEIFKEILPALHNALAEKHLRLDDIFDRVLASRAG